MSQFITLFISIWHHPLVYAGFAVTLWTWGLYCIIEKEYKYGRLAVVAYLFATMIVITLCAMAVEIYA